MQRFIKIMRFPLLIGLGLVLFYALYLMMALSPAVHDNLLTYDVADKVVRVLSVDQSSGGTGFFVKTKSGKVAILTNRHVCGLANNKEELLVQSQYGDQQKYKVKVIARYTGHDLCLVEAPPINQGYLDIASSVDVNDTLYVVGHPGLRPITLSKGNLIGTAPIKLMEGVNITADRCFGEFVDLEAKLEKLREAKKRCESEYPDTESEQFNACVERVVEDSGLSFTDFLLIMQGIRNFCIVSHPYNYMVTPIIHGGNSGSPIVNFWGNVVAVVFAGNNDQITDNYAVPIEVVKDFLSKY